MKITVMKTKIAKNRSPQVPQTKFTPVSLICFTTPPSLNSERAQRNVPGGRGRSTSAAFKRSMFSAKWNSLEPILISVYAKEFLTLKIHLFNCKVRF